MFRAALDHSRRNGDTDQVWVTDGTRTRDPQDHNLMLYQLSYDHHEAPKV